MATDVLENPFIKDWKEHQTNVLSRIYPEADNKTIDKFLDKKIEKNLINRPASLHNNHSHRKININLLDATKWIHEVKPITAGFGMFYRNQDQQINPNAVMLQKFMKLRKVYKGKLHHLQPGSFEYATADRQQLTEKINANSFYGCSGAPSSRFFNLYTAASVTLTGQSLISTAAMAFEAFLGNNVGFYDLDNCFEYVENIRKEKYSLDDSFLPSIPPSTVLKHLKSMFYEYDDKYDFALFRYVLELSPKLLKRIYFKNNLYAFSKLNYIQELTLNTVRNVDDFKDPNSVPDSIKSNMDNLWELYNEFVFYNYSPVGRIDRLRTRTRKSVIVVDTDSNFLNLHPWVEHVMEVCSVDSDVASRDYDNLRFIAVNMMCFYLTKMINAVLWKYTKGANIPKEYRSGINMKNEFLYTKLVTINKKKRYIGSIRLREGTEIFPEKLDIKGLDFMKSTTRQETQDTFKKIIKQRIIDHPTADIINIYSDLAGFSSRITDSINKGEKDFLSPMTVKDYGVYKFPLREQSVRGTMAWNAAYPSNQISPPEKVDIVKVRMETLADLEDLERTHPEIYENLRRGIFMHDNPEVVKKGISVFAIPRNVPEIPEWLRPYVDTTTIKNDNISRFNAVMESLGTDTIQLAGKSFYSNIKKLG